MLEPASPRSPCIFGSARSSEPTSPGTTTGSETFHGRSSPRSLNRPMTSPMKQGPMSPRSLNRPGPPLTPSREESKLSRSASSPDGFKFSQQAPGSPPPTSRSSTLGTLAESPASPRRAAWAAKRTESKVLHEERPSPSLSLRSGVAPWMDPYKADKKQSKFETNSARDALNKAGSPYSFNLYERRGVGEFSPRNPNRASSSPTTKQQLNQSLSLFDAPISCQPEMSFRKAAASPHRDRSPSPDGEPEGQPAGKESRGMAKADTWRCMSRYNSTGDLGSNWKRGVGEFSPRARAESPTGDDSRFNFIAGAESRINDSQHLGRDVASPRDKEHVRRLHLESSIKMTRQASLPILLGLQRQYAPPEDFDATILPSSEDYEDLMHRPSPRHSPSKPPVTMRLLAAAGEWNETSTSPRSSSAPDQNRARMLAGDVLTKVATLKPSPSSASTACSAAGSTPGQTPRDAMVAELQMFGQRRRLSAKMQQSRQQWNNATSTGKSPRGKEPAGYPYSARASYERVPAGVTSNRCRTDRDKVTQPEWSASPPKPTPRTYPSMAAPLSSRLRRQSQEGQEAMRQDKMREPPYFRANQASRRTPEKVDGLQSGASAATTAASSNDGQVKCPGRI